MRRYTARGAMIDWSAQQCGAQGALPVLQGRNPADADAEVLR